MDSMLRATDRQNQQQVAGYASCDAARPCWMESRAPGTRSLKASESVESYYEESSVSDQESGSTWARLIAQVYEVDPLTCSRCGSPMRILAVITDPAEVKKILRYLVKIGRSPPGLDPSFV